MLITKTLTDLKAHVDARTLIGSRIGSHVWVPWQLHARALQWLRDHNVRHYDNGSFGVGVRGIHITN